MLQFDVEIVALPAPPLTCSIFLILFRIILARHLQL